MNEQGVQKLLQDRVTLGAGAAVAPGPIEGQPMPSADPTSTEMLSYTRAQGLFLDLAGATIRPDTDSNGNVYGSGATPRNILAESEISAPTEAHALLSALRLPAPAAATADRAAADRTTATVTQSPSAGAAPAPPGPEDLRARIVDIEQMLDRILADTTPAPVGTSGTTGSAAQGAPVTVDRSRLLQIRQQLEGLLAALNRR